MGNTSEPTQCVALQETQERQIRFLGWKDPLEGPQYSCLETPMDRGAWRAPVHGVAESRT